LEQDAGEGGAIDEGVSGLAADVETVPAGEGREWNTRGSENVQSAGGRSEKKSESRREV